MLSSARRTLLGALPGLTLARGAGARVNGVALVVGNASYQWVTPLANPGRDARATGALLEALGLRTELLLDADRATFTAALQRLAQRSQGAEVALLFFAGHGVQRNNLNWLVPVDADLQAGAAAPRQMIGLNDAVQAMARAQSRVVLLDACRNDPMAGSTADTRGLARVDEAPAGSLICFSTSPGRVALDGTGQHSPFTDALLDHLGTPGLEFRQVLTRVRRRVLIATDGQQIPWDTSSLTNDLNLRASGERPVPRPNLDPPPAPVAPARPSPGNRPLSPQPDNAAASQGEVRYDPQRFREIPRTYEHARANSFILPDGLLVERRNAAGEETPLTGGYVEETAGVNAVVILSYDTRAQRVSYLRCNSSRSTLGASWSQIGGTFVSSVIQATDSRGNSTFRLDLNSGFALLRLDARGHPGGGTMITRRFRRIE